MKTILAVVIAVIAVLALPVFAVEMSDGYLRASAPGAPVGAAFMTLHNSSDSAIAMVAVESTLSETVEMHNHTNVDGVMQMRQVDKIELPANGKAVLKPGSFHLMLMGLKQQLAVGDSGQIRVRFSDGSEQVLDLPVKKVTAKPMIHGDGEHKNGSTGQMNTMAKPTN
ncbi:MAG: copper chaperone PCu(A)C [Motiliproteus sp.]